MNNNPELIVMLTHNDRTVHNAYRIFEQCKHSKAKFWGLKQEGLSIDEMKKLFKYMKQYKKSTILEVVAYTEAECVEGAKIAIECDCDILMGTLFFDSINELCKKHNLKYMPFVGEVSEYPSVLNGDIDNIISEAKRYLEKGVDGFDLLGYRYTGDVLELNHRFVSEINAPVCVAGSIDDYDKLDEVIALNSWSFTIGGAFFENKFDGTFSEQIDKVCDYIDNSFARELASSTL